MNFRIRHFGTLFVLAIALTNSTLQAQDEPKTPLAKNMTAINAAFKVIGRQIGDASKNANTIEQLTIIETNAKAALTLVPEKKEQVPAAEHAKFMAGYQAGMKEFLSTVTAMRAALKSGNNAEAEKLLGTMKSQQRDSHKDYRIRKAGAPPAL